MRVLINQQLKAAEEQCATEQIHLFASIQPHGALLVLASKDNLTVLQASENIGQFLDIPADGVCNQSLATLIGLAPAQQIATCVEDLSQDQTVSLSIELTYQNQAIRLSIHLFVSSNNMVGLELFPDDETLQSASSTRLLLQTQQTLLRADKENNLELYLDQLAVFTQKLIGFDRIMVYRLDPASWDGEIIVEKRSAEAPSFLGLRFPASDIPAQARQMYLLNRVRIVIDVEATPVAVLPALNPVTHQPFDMTYSALRCFSPVHIQYLRNMGVQASLSISLLQNGRLWGLIACHHLSPKPISNFQRECACLISQMASAKLSSLEWSEKQSFNADIVKLISTILKIITPYDVLSILHGIESSLLELFDATGMIAVVEGTPYALGHVPERSHWQGLLGWLESLPAQAVFACDDLALRYPAATAFSSIASGLLATPVGSPMLNAMIWLRPEKPATVSWGGNPEKTVTTQDNGSIRLDPRHSFEAWTQEWRQHSESWTNVQIDAAKILGMALSEGLSQRRQQQEEQLKNQRLQTEVNYSRGIYQTLVDASLSDGVYIHDHSGRFLDVNERACEHTGYSKAELLGMNVSDIEIGAEFSTIQLAWAQLAPGISTTFLGNHRRKNGNQYPVEIHVSVYIHQNQRLYIAFVRDITDRLEAEASLRSSEAAFRQLAEAMPQIVWVDDAQGYNIYFNSQWVAFTGLSLQESHGIGWLEALHPNDRESCWLAWQNAVQTNGKYELDCRLRRIDGEYRWFLIRGVPINDDSGVCKWFGTCTDIHDITLTQEALRRSENLMTSVMDSIPGSLAVTNAQGTIIAVNKAWRDFAEANQGNTLVQSGIGLNYLDQCCGSPQNSTEFDVVYQGMQAVLNGVNDSFAMEYPCHSADSERWFRLGVNPLNGDELGLVTHHLNITERIQAEIALSQKNDVLIKNELQLKRVLDTLQAGIVVADKETSKLIYANEFFCQMFGYDVEQLKQMHVADLMPETSRKLGINLFRESVSGNVNLKESVPMQRLDGSVFFAEIRDTHIEMNNKPALMGLFTDITKRKKYEDEREHYRQYLEATMETQTRTLMDTMFALDSVGTAIVWTDVEIGRILSINRAGIELLGYSQEEVQALTVPDIDFELRLNPQQFAEIGAVIKKLGFIKFDRTLVTKTGRCIPVELSVYYQPENAHSPARFIAFCSDISERKASEQALQNAKQLAEESSKAKAVFLANMSHEIRTPINAILGFSQLVLRNELTADTRNYLNKVHLSAEHLLGIINDILDFSKIEAGKLEVEKIEFRVDVLLNQLQDFFRNIAYEKGLELTVGMMPDVPNILWGDPLRLSQILINLLGNALKFTNQGEISLIIDTMEQVGTTIKLRFLIQDSGIGMTEEQLSSLFDAFHQADASTTRKYGGTGLGLVISQKLVRLMGGSIAVQSQPGQGSQFSFTLEFPILDESKLDASEFSDKRVWVVDDSRIMCNLLVNLLGSFGCQVEAFNTGEQLLARLALGSTADLILLDWHLQDIDGMVLAQQIKNLTNTPPIILITADDHVQKHLLDSHQSEQFEHLMIKPINPLVLHDTLLELFSGQKKPPTLMAMDEKIPNLAGYRILLVDDNAFNREVGFELIKLTGASVTLANDGQQAVDAVVKEPYDAVLMDIQMPIMDGYTAAILIREQFKTLPIIALTAHAMQEERARVLEAGMSGFVTKPIQTKQLYDALINALKGATPIESPVMSATNPQSPIIEFVDADHDVPLSLPGFDVVNALERLAGDMNHYRRFLKLFRERNATMLEKLLAELEAGNIDTAKRLVHTLKGTAGTIGALDLQHAAQMYEIELKTLTITDSVLTSQLLNELKTQFAQAMKTLELIN